MLTKDTEDKSLKLALEGIPLSNYYEISTKALFYLSIARLVLDIFLVSKRDKQNHAKCRYTVSLKIIILEKTKKKR